MMNPNIMLLLSCWMQSSNLLCNNMKKRTILFAFLLALLAMVVSYVSTNIKVTFFGERNVLKYWSAISNRLFGNNSGTIPDNVIFIDVSKDQQLVEIKSEYGETIGKVAITDRHKLADLLSIINSQDYTYVIMDILFEEGYETEADSALFSIISSMDRIVIPCHADAILSGSVPAEKTAYADYGTNLKEDDFAKYPILDKKGVSMPLKVYSSLTGRTIKKTGLLYTDGAYVSRRTIFPKMYVQIGGPKKMRKFNDDANVLDKQYYSMGANIVDDDPEAVEGLFDNKLVVIGSFSDDIHTTYAGDIPGCVINYNVYESLKKGQHRIPYVLILIYFLLFFVMSYILLNGNPDKTSSMGWLWAKLFVIYSVILTIICIFVFEIWGQSHDIFITSTLFSIVDTCHKMILKKKRNA